MALSVRPPSGRGSVSWHFVKKMSRNVNLAKKGEKMGGENYSNKEKGNR